MTNREKEIGIKKGEDTNWCLTGEKLVKWLVRVLKLISGIHI